MKKVLFKIFIKPRKQSSNEREVLLEVIYPENGRMIREVNGSRIDLYCPFGYNVINSEEFSELLSIRKTECKIGTILEIASRGLYGDCEMADDLELVIVKITED